MAAPAFQTVGARTSVTGTSATPAMPAGIAANDTLILYGAVNATGVTFTTPAGWTAGPTTNAGGQSAAMFWKNAAGGDTSPTLVWSVSAASCTKVIRFSGAGTPATPIGATATNFGNSGTITNGQITTTAANSAIVNLLSTSGFLNINTPNTPPGTYTNIAAASGPPGDNESWGISNVSGSTTTAVSTPMSGSAAWTAISFEINGSGAAGVDNVRATGVVQQVLETYSNLTNVRATGVNQSVLETYSDPTNVRATQVVLQVLRTTAVQKPRAWGYGLWG
jgi:hypothetical protein